MSAASRRKGLAGEREIADAYERSGFEVRGLEGSGDHLVICRRGFVIHSEVKRTEKLRLYDSLDQMMTEAPFGTLPVLHFRRNRSRWYVAMAMEDWRRVIA